MCELLVFMESIKTSNSNLLSRAGLVNYIDWSHARSQSSGENKVYGEQ